jgi:peptidylprolyl isomerase
MKITSTGVAIGLAIVVALGLIFFGPAVFTSPALDLEQLPMTDNANEEVGATAPGGAMALPTELPTTLTATDQVVGQGAEATKGDQISVHYTGMLADGTVFDSSKSRGPFTFVVGAGSVIVGWDQGLIGMKEGGKRMLIIPPDMGYGAQDLGVIPPNSTLIFEVELLSVTKP